MTIVTQYRLTDAKVGPMEPLLQYDAMGDGLVHTPSNRCGDCRR